MYVCGTDLEKGTDYRVRISALTVNGTGPVTGWLHATTYHNDLDGEWTESLWSGFSVLVLNQVRDRGMIRSSQDLKVCDKGIMKLSSLKVCEFGIFWIFVVVVYINVYL